jgi:hypothetical protein
MRGSIAQPWSKTLSRTKGRRRNLGDLAFGRAKVCRAGPHGEGDEPKPMMNGREKSDPAVVAAKSTNEAGQPGEEWMECRAGVSHALGHIRRAVHLRLSRQTLEVEAGCGKAARPVLCGGA